MQRVKKKNEINKSINLPPQIQITVLSALHSTCLFSGDELAPRSRIKFQDGIEKRKQELLLGAI